MSQANWYYAKSGQQLGPINFESLAAMRAGGQLQSTDLVWSEGMADWVPAGSIAALNARPATPVMPHVTPPPGNTIPYYAPDGSVRYARFFSRVVAAFIDGIVLWIASFILAFVLGQGIHYSRQPAGAAYFGIQIAGLLISWFYGALMESSEHQATLGKMAVGIRVTDLIGNRLTFARATGRHFAKYLSAIILCIGYLMAAFTQRKQALHDILAETLVVKK